MEFDVLSFVKGQGGVRDVRPRIESIARFLRSREVPVREAALCYEKVGRDGKGDWCYEHRVHEILDDSSDIIKDCRDPTPIFAVQVYPSSNSIRDAIYTLRSRLQECSHEEFLREYSP